MTLGLEFTYLPTGPLELDDQGLTAGYEEDAVVPSGSPQGVDLQDLDAESYSILHYRFFNCLLLTWLIRHLPTP
jgi:hypothetical protein